MISLSDLKVKIFADGADKTSILNFCEDRLIRGFTTNPTLMRKAGVQNYQTFAQEIVAAVPNYPISFEVFSDDLSEMEEQALKIASWGDNVYVKIPVTNTQSTPTYELMARLGNQGIKVNATALMTLEQVEQVATSLVQSPSSYISLFAGRIADTGIDPLPIMAEAVSLLRAYPHLELIWASPRELLNIFQADSVGCHIITVSYDILRKLSLVNKDLDEYSLETVKMFYEDAQQAGYSL